MAYQIGCDIGGTFTDVVVYDDDGRKWEQKADTTPDQLIEGVKQVINTVADEIGISTSELLEQTTRFVNGTTVVTNNIIELNGARTGLLTTKGFGDTLRIARSPHGEERDQHEQMNVPEIIPQNCIKEIPERIDDEGNVVVPLDESAIRKSVTELVEDEDAETVAVCFLWSFLNADHELRAKELIEQEYPELYVTTSQEIYPKIREYERMVTTTLNAYTAPQVAEYVDVLRSELSEMGLDTSIITLMQAAGGSTTPEEAKQKPIQLLDSGPVGGVIGVNGLAKQLGRDNVIAADMGGTSFECSLIENQEYTLSDRTEVLREVETGLTKVETNTIGAGGGSIAWIDERGVPQVGPQSTGADPGPACYDRGGEEPTLTDAALVLGLMDPESFLAGRRELNANAAKRAIREKVGTPLGRNATETAADIYELGVTSMSNAVRNVTIEEGRDPTDFTFFAYGGALPMFAADICATLGIEEVLIPDGASVFSANGLLQADDVRTYAESVFWNPGDSVESVNETVERIENKVRSQLESAGFDEDDISIEREGRFKFKGQLFDQPVSLPDGQITRDDLDEIRDEFPGLYEAEYGPGTAWIEAPVILRGVRVTGSGQTDKPPVSNKPTIEGEAGPVASREIYLPQERRQAEVQIFEGDALASDTTIKGPAILEEPITTVFVPRNHEIMIDQYGNYVLTQHDDTERVSASAEPVQE